MAKVKICGLFRIADAMAANRAMPDYVGFVFAKSRRQVPPVQAAEMQLTPEETAYLEAPYVPHALVGVIAQNTRAAAGEKQVWTVEDKKA